MALPKGEELVFGSIVRSQVRPGNYGRNNYGA